MNLDTPGLDTFVESQLREWGGQHEVDAGSWALFGYPVDNVDARALATGLLDRATFPHAVGHSEDDRWEIHYVDTANRGAAMHWLEDLQRQLVGAFRLPSPAQRASGKELLESPVPHRLAQSLGESHKRGDLGAGSLREPAIVRGLLDRLHQHEPLFFNAFHHLLTHHLIDMVVLLQQMIPEDVQLANEALSGAVSRDPFLQTRQVAAAEIRKIFVEFCLINALDQQKNTAVQNPYAAYLDILAKGDELLLSIDGVNVTAPRKTFVDAIHSIRKNLYLGGELERFDTQAPWMRPEIAHSFRFIKQRLETHRDLSTMDGLYMLERAVEV
jgi:hypothetical protein